MAPPLGIIKAKPACVQLLEKQLSNADPAIRKTGADSIPNIKAPAKPLAECLETHFDHQNWYAKRSAVSAATRAIESKDAANPTIQVLTNRLDSSDCETRKCAGRALAGIANAACQSDASKLIPQFCAENAAQAAADCLEHEDPRVRQNAVESLALFSDSAAPHASRLAKRLTDTDGSVRRSVATACTTLGVVATEAAEDVSRLTNHQEDCVRASARNAAFALSTHSGPDVAAAVIQALQVCSDASVRRETLDLMCDLGALMAPHGKVLASFLDDADFGVRCCAIRAMVSAGPNVSGSSLEHVLRRTEQQDRDLRRSAVDAMRALAPMCPQYAAAVGKSLQETAETIQQRCDVFRILGGAGANAGPFLEDMSYGLDDKDWAVRRATIEAFEDLKEYATEAAPHVARHLLHHSPNVRRAAAETLGRMGLHCGPYANRVEAMLDTEEDEDVLHTCQQAHQMLLDCGAYETKHPTSPPPSPLK